MFASKSLTEHLARGFVALRGCPSRWLVGLVQLRFAAHSAA